MKFKHKQEFKKHIASFHPKTFDCKYCDKEFDFSWKLEIHLKSHEQVEQIKCDKCDKTFSLKWRLIQHVKMHENSEIRKCHYFNNQKNCPFEEIGCMFKHADATNCKFLENCSRKMCPFKHNTIENVDKENQAAIVIVSEETDYDSEQEECDTCERIFKNNIDINEHHRNDNCGFECKICGECYKFENDLKLHQNENCT